MVLRTGRGAYALPVEATSAVLEPIGLEPLPSPRPGVLGLLRPQRHGLPVLDVLDTEGEHVVVVEAAGRRFGLLVAAVSGVVRVPPSAFGPAPEGQELRVVCARAATVHGSVLVLDPVVLAQQLG